MFFIQMIAAVMAVAGVFLFQPDNVVPLRLLAVDTIDDSLGLVQNRLVSMPGAQENRETLVILANFTATSPPPLTADAVRDTVFGTVDAFYREQSYGKVGFRGDVLDWISLPMSPTCSMTDVRQAAISAVDSGIDFHRYDTVVLIAPYGNCGWSGLSSRFPFDVQTDEGPMSLYFAYVQSGSASSHVIGHELGHILGSGHSGFLNCGSASIASSGCTSSEYADYFDVMGRGVPLRHWNAIHKLRAGWFDGQQRLVLVQESGIFELTPLEDQSSGIKALRIPRPDGNDLFVEYRQSLGFDTGMDQDGYSDVFTGALLHVPAGNRYTWLIDPTTPAEPHRSALTMGPVFTDPLTHISIRVRQRSPKSLIVEIHYPDQTVRGRWNVVH